jgi:hypothetical protein
VTLITRSGLTCADASAVATMRCPRRSSRWPVSDLFGDSARRFRAAIAGDGVVIPRVRFLAEHILEPVLQASTLATPEEELST